MKSLHSPIDAARIVLGMLAALALLAAATAAASSAPVTSDQFAPGWQAHAKSLFNSGIGQVTDRRRWYVPATIPRGEYVLVQRTGDKAEVIDGYRFTVTSGFGDLYLFLPPGYSNVQALPVGDLPAAAEQVPGDRRTR